MKVNFIHDIMPKEVDLYKKVNSDVTEKLCYILQKKKESFDVKYTRLPFRPKNQVNPYVETT